MKKALFAVIATLWITIAVAAEEPVWVTAEGESYQGEMDTPKEVRDRAKRDAERRAVEKSVGIFIKSHTLVSNNQIAEDLMYAAVRGKIIQEKIVASNWDTKERNLYRINIEARVEPVYPEKGEGLFAKISLSKTDLKEGDEVQIFYHVSKDSYVYIFSVAADGSVTLLLPNLNLPDNFTKAGTAYQFPPSGSKVNLKAIFLPNYEAGSAEERIKIIATRQEEKLLPLGFRHGIFQVYDVKSTGMINDLVKRLNQIEPTDWAEATAVYTLKK